MFAAELSASCEAGEVQGGDEVVGRWDGDVVVGVLGKPGRVFGPGEKKVVGGRVEPLVPVESGCFLDWANQVLEPAGA